ncbi:LlaJI family restriction endonuclease, partial [Enterococcus faecalis]|nr:LlaJI family restriction endonuclease [Enterococcus faecalis]EHY9269133.1 LlaJI family restriction endonuclease [Enterococcus faecalis]
GWLFDLNHPKEKTFINLTIEQQILLLEKELRTTYKTRDIKLIQNLLIYLKDTENNYFSIMLLTPYFYSIWEQMLKLAFKHDSTLMGKVPKPYWYLTGNPFKLYTKQIPDILISKDNTLLIIDAKYYSIKPKNVKKFPGWESIVKQLYYNLSLNNIGFQKIKNIFIMPSSLQPKTYEYLGYSSVEDKENELGLVLAYSLDLQVILESYISGNRPTNILEQLVKDTYLRPN